MPADVSLTAADINAFTQRRSAIRADYQRGLANNAFQTGVAQLGFQRGRRSLTRNFNEVQQQLPAQFAQRGLLNSGIYRRQNVQLGQEYRTQLGDLNFNFQTQLGGLRQNRLDTETAFQLGLADVDVQQQLRRSQLAAQLRSLR